MAHRCRDLGTKAKRVPLDCRSGRVDRPILRKGRLRPVSVGDGQDRPVIGECTGGRRARIGIRRLEQGFEPARSDDAIAIDDDDVAWGGGAERRIHVPYEAEIQRLPEHVEPVPEGAMAPRLSTKPSICGSGLASSATSTGTSVGVWLSTLRRHWANRSPGRRLGCTPPAGPAPRGQARPERAGECRRSAPLGRTAGYEILHSAE